MAAKRGDRFTMAALVQGRGRVDMLGTTLFGAFGAAAVAVWVVAAWSFWGMLKNVRDGRWWRLLVNPAWWLPHRTEEFLEAEGMPHYRRLMKAIVSFLGLVLAGIVFGFVMVLTGG